MENKATTTSQVTAGIVGGAGFTGGEVLRLLLHHPHVSVRFIQSRSQAGKPVVSVHRDLVGETEAVFSDTIQPADVVFLCLGHGESQALLQQQPFPSHTRLIDLGNDFRIADQPHSHTFVYGLPEFQRDSIRQANRVANPGCFATAIQLALLPLAAEGLLHPAHVTGITGSTGAGQKLQDTTHFTWRSQNISAYKTLRHQHLAEIGQTLRALQATPAPVHFVPWRGDFTRGIFVSAVVTTHRALAENIELYRNYYAPHPFTHVVDEPLDLKMVVNTNKCLLQLEQEGNQLVVHSALDNLLKGASGQAVQNMNLMFGWDETSGLRIKGSVF